MAADFINYGGDLSTPTADSVYELGPLTSLSAPGESAWCQNEAERLADELGLVEGYAFDQATGALSILSEGMEGC